MLGSLAPWRERSLFSTPRLPRTMGRMEHEMEDLMERFLGDDREWLADFRGFVPTTDVVESENQFEVTVDLPGLKPEEVNVELKDGALWVTGKREEDKEQKGKTLHRIERRVGEFRRVLPLPSAIREEKIDAKFEDGVLKIIVPKTDEAKSKQIKVKS